MRAGASERSDQIAAGDKYVVPSLEITEKSIWNIMVCSVGSQTTRCRWAENISIDYALEWSAEITFYCEMKACMRWTEGHGMRRSDSDDIRRHIRSERASQVDMCAALGRDIKRRVAIVSHAWRVVLNCRTLWCLVVSLNWNRLVFSMIVILYSP